MPRLAKQGHPTGWLFSCPPAARIPVSNRLFLPRPPYNRRPMADLPLYRHPPFLLLWLASVASGLGLAVAMLAETWYAVKVLQLKAELGYLMLAGSLPRIALMALGGVLADRWPRARIMAGSFALRALLLGLMTWAAAQQQLDLSLLIVLAAGFGMLDALFWPARDAMLPAIVPAAQLGQANAWMLATNQLGMLLGPVVGGLLLAGLSFAWVFGLTALAMLLGAAFALGIREQARRDNTRQAIWPALQEGLACVRDTPVLRLLLLIYALANLLFMGPLGFAPPLLAANLPGASAGLLAQLQSAFAAGMLAGGVLLALRPPMGRRLQWICWLIALEGLLLAALPQLNAGGATLVQFALGFCIACNNVPMLSLLQQYSPPERIGRVMSLNSMASLGLTPLAYALSSLLLGAGASLGLLAAVCGLLLSLFCALVALLSPTARHTR